MNKWIGTIIAAIFILQGSIQLTYSQHYHKHLPYKGGNRIICYYSETPGDRHIPPPESYTSRLKSGEEPGAVFNFTINNSPSVFADSAAKLAGEIWGSLIYSPVPINVEVNFEDMEGLTLAATGVPWPPYILDPNGYLPERIYVQALAEKFYKMNLNGNSPDMTMTYNLDVNWYFDTDGNTPSTKFDFLSTMIHEIAHGLGFYGYFWVENGDGNGPSIPSAFDGFFENSLGQRLSDTLIFPHPSEKLGDALTTPPVYFDSPIVAKELPGEPFPPKMYTPSEWRPGNSLYHLDEWYDVANGGRDQLMTYSTAPGDAVHDPGPITKYMLYEIGWVHTYIQTDTLKDRENLDEPFTAKAKIYGDIGIAPGSQYLVYSFDGFQTENSVAMVPSGQEDEFMAVIPVPGLNTTVNYYLKTQDSYGRTYTLPANAPEFFYRFHVGPDNTPPVIDEHEVITGILTVFDSVLIAADISDNLGLDVTRVEYKINDVDQAPIDLEFVTDLRYNGYFVFSEGQLKDGDIIKYRIKAVDGSVSQHTTFLPTSGYHEFNVKELPPPVNAYSNDFESGIGDFTISDVGFNHSKPNGFSSWGLHSDHPYSHPDRDGEEDSSWARLDIPIRLNADHMAIRFDEIAYIEPGEPGTEYGDSNFWDYVIVEGSKDYGKTWIELVPGWDCRYQKSWSDHYSDPSYKDGNNSLAVPDESAMRTRLINLLGRTGFKGGDIIMIRFWLFADPYAYGWGWAIDNLEISSVVSAGEYSMIPGSIDVYPNPSTGLLNVNVQMTNEVEEIEIALFDMVGKEIFMETYGSPGLSFSQYFDLSTLANGVYLMKFTSGNQSVMKKVILTR